MCDCIVIILLSGDPFDLLGDPVDSRSESSSTSDSEAVILNWKSYQEIYSFHVGSPKKHRMTK